MEWIPITEQAPPRYTKVLLTVKEQAWDVEKGFYERTYVVCRAWSENSKALAWMPLPEPYKENVT